MAKKKNGKNKGKITKERNKVMDSIRIEKQMENLKITKKTYTGTDTTREESTLLP